MAPASRGLLSPAPPSRSAKGSLPNNGRGGPVDYLTGRPRPFFASQRRRLSRYQRTSYLRRLFLEDFFEDFLDDFLGAGFSSSSSSSAGSSSAGSSSAGASSAASVLSSVVSSVDSSAAGSSDDVSSMLVSMLVSSLGVSSPPPAAFASSASKKATAISSRNSPRLGVKFRWVAILLAR